MQPLGADVWMHMLVTHASIGQTLTRPSVLAGHDDEFAPVIVIVVVQT